MIIQLFAIDRLSEPSSLRNTYQFRCELPKLLNPHSPSRSGEVRHLGTFANRADQIAKMVEKLAKDGRRLSFCYEAGPCGYGLYRQLISLGHDCIVVATFADPDEGWRPGQDGPPRRSDAGQTAPGR